ncbi:hypothetical protein ACLB2K_059982 [Fragaria x ananassa]
MNTVNEDGKKRKRTVGAKKRKRTVDEEDDVVLLSKLFLGQEKMRKQEKPKKKKTFEMEEKEEDETQKRKSNQFRSTWPEMDSFRDVLDEEALNGRFLSGCLRQRLKSKGKGSSRGLNTGGCAHLILYWLCEKTNIIKPIEDTKDEEHKMRKWDLTKLTKKVQLTQLFAGIKIQEKKIVNLKKKKNNLRKKQYKRN